MEEDGASKVSKDQQIVEYLEEDEFAIECLVRNIVGSPTRRIAILRECIRKEGSVQDTPAIAHRAAREDPHTEIVNCSSKLTALRKQFVGKIDNRPAGDVVDIELINKAKATIWHVQCRLYRMLEFSSEHSIALRLINICANFLKLLRENELSAENLNQSLQELDNPENDQNSLNGDEPHSNVPNVMGDDPIPHNLSSTPIQTPSNVPVASASNAQPQPQRITPRQGNPSCMLASNIPRQSSGNSSSYLPNMDVRTNSQNNIALSPSFSKRFNTILNGLEELDPFSNPPALHSSENPEYTLPQYQTMSKTIAFQQTPKEPTYGSGRSYYGDLLTNQNRRGENNNGPYLERPNRSHGFREYYPSGPIGPNQYNHQYGSDQHYNHYSNKGTSGPFIDIPSQNFHQPSNMGGTTYPAVDHFRSNPCHEYMFPTDRYAHKPDYHRHVSLAREERNLRFRGSLNDISIDKFLYRFECSALSHGIPVDRFVHEIKGLLEDYALEFYWSYQENYPMSTWPQLREALRNHFKEGRDDFDIRCILDNRKQRIREPFEEFLSDIRRITMRLKAPLTEIEMVMLLLRNMSPDLHSKLAGQIPKRVSELISRCLAIEDAMPRFTSRYDIPKRVVHEVHFEEDKRSETYNETVEAINMKLKCWNCSGPHTFFDCRELVKHRFCFGCGRPGLLKPDCPKCKDYRPGNSSGEMKKPGTLHFQSQTPCPRLPPIETATNTDPELLRRQHPYPLK